VDIRIGVTYTAKEIALELADDLGTDAVKAKVDGAVSGSDPVLWLEDKKGNQVAIPAEKIAYVEIGSGENARPIGFG
jgi:hypothetical protein